MHQIHAVKKGSGPPVVLIHGFPMNHQVWCDFADQLSSGFTVYTPDLPGFGDSPLPAEYFTISDIATLLLQWLAEEKIENSVLIGHSLGGYVSLAMVEQEPERFAALGLFHSTALADSAEKKESRTKVLEFIDKNGVKAFTANFIQPLFVNQQHPAIERVKAITTQTESETVKGYTIAMRDRPDRRHVLGAFNKPVLFISGEKDGSIPVQTIQEQARLCTLPEVHVRDSVAHMGMFEKPDESVTILQSFVSRASLR